MVTVCCAGFEQSYILNLDLESFYSLYSSVSRCKATEMMYLCNIIRAAALADQKGFAQFASSLQVAATGEQQTKPTGNDANDFIRKFGTGV